MLFKQRNELMRSFSKTRAVRLPHLVKKKSRRYNQASHFIFLWTRSNRRLLPDLWSQRSWKRKEVKERLGSGVPEESPRRTCLAQRATGWTGRRSDAWREDGGRPSLYGGLPRQDNGPARLSEALQRHSGSTDFGCWETRRKLTLSEKYDDLNKS